MSPNDPFIGWIREIKMTENYETQIPTDTIPCSSVIVKSNKYDYAFKHNEQITITAIFYEEITSNPTISFSGVVSNVLLGLITATETPSVWLYNWTVPNIDDAFVSVTVSGTDLAGNNVFGH